MGSRALDILIALVIRAGEVVSNRDLIKLVWRDVVVDESCLRVHISALRKALSCSESDTRYISNIPGRGYSFVASGAYSPVTLDIQTLAHRLSVDSLPPRLARMVGREDTVIDLAEQLKHKRFVTISGPGGIGKTTVAVAVAHHLISDFDGLLHFLDIGSITDPDLLTGTLASALGIRGHRRDIAHQLACFLRSKRLLLVLDGCDHVIDAATDLAEKLYLEAGQVHILATSREPLRAEGEHVYRLCALACPPEQGELTASTALTFSAVQLFVERAASNGSVFTLSDSDASVVAHICRKLDGIALAIELGAGRVEAYGIRGTAELLNSRFSLLWDGRRTALPRHQTLNSMLDWSYDLLSETESTVLRQLSVLNGGFSLETAEEVVDAQGTEMMFVDAIGRLVAKSLIEVDSVGKSMRYRLLDTTRAYALDKLRTKSEIDTATKRLAHYVLSLLGRINVTAGPYPEHKHTHSYIEHLGNIRAALEWALAERGDLELGIHLAAASAPFFLGLSMLDECRRWSEQALAAVQASSFSGTCQELVLLEAFAVSSMFMSGNTHAVQVALTRGVELSEHLADTPRQLRLLAGLNIFLARAGDFQAAMTAARLNMKISTLISDPDGMAMAQWMLGVSCHLVGEQEQAQQLCTAGLSWASTQPQTDAIYFGYDHRIRALVTLARVLWLRGYPDQAVLVSRQALDDAHNLRHPVTICISLIYVSTVFLWVGDWKAAEHTIDQLILTSGQNSLEPDQALGMGLKGIQLIRQGETDAGMHLLHECLDVLNIENHQVLVTMFISCLAEGFAAKGEFGNALEMIGRALTLSDSVGETFDTPEILRITAELHMSKATPELELAERYLNRSLTCASRQSALAWELRSATSLARLRLLQGRDIEAGRELGEIYGRFTEGSDSMDLRRARKLLHALNGIGA